MVRTGYCVIASHWSYDHWSMPGITLRGLYDNARALSRTLLKTLRGLYDNAQVRVYANSIDSPRFKSSIQPIWLECLVKSCSKICDIHLNNMVANDIAKICTKHDISNFMSGAKFYKDLSPHIL